MHLALPENLSRSYMSIKDTIFWSSFPSPNKIMIWGKLKLKWNSRNVVYAIHMPEERHGGLNFVIGMKPLAINRYQIQLIDLVTDNSVYIAIFGEMIKDTTVETKLR